jgi:hypothetical protein
MRLMKFPVARTKTYPGQGARPCVPSGSRWEENPLAIFHCPTSVLTRCASSRNIMRGLVFFVVFAAIVRASRGAPLSIAITFDYVCGQSSISLSIPQSDGLTIPVEVRCLGGRRSCRMMAHKGDGELKNVSSNGELEQDVDPMLLSSEVSSGSSGGASSSSPSRVFHLTLQ